MARKKQMIQPEFKLFEANDVAKYGIMSVAGNALEPTSYKALVYAIWKCNQITPGQFDWVEMSTTELGEALGYVRDKNCNFARSVKRICNIIKGIMSRPLSIQNSDEKKVISFVWVQRVEIDYGNDRIRIRFSDVLSLYFGQELQKNFTVVKLKYLNRLTTTASVILYPFFCRYLNLGTFNYLVEDISRLIVGVKEFEYKRLKCDFFAPAIKAINARTDLYITFKENKQGRQVKSLAFTIIKSPAEDEFEHFMDYNGLKNDESTMLPYDTNWMNFYEYDMAIQKYRKIKKYNSKEALSPK